MPRAPKGSVRLRRGTWFARVTVASGQRTELALVTCEEGDEVARYASLLLSGTYAAEYLRLGLVED